MPLNNHAQEDTSELLNIIMQLLTDSFIANKITICIDWLNEGVGEMRSPITNIFGILEDISYTCQDCTKGFVKKTEYFEFLSLPINSEANSIYCLLRDYFTPEEDVSYNCLFCHKKDGKSTHQVSIA